MGQGPITRQTQLDFQFPSQWLYHTSTRKAQKAKLMPKQPLRHLDIETFAILVTPGMR